jgi:hypothetical protein
MSKEQTYQGSCFCGAVEFTVTGEPAAMGYCHCESCRHWSGGPVNAFSLWNPEAVKITKGADNIGTYNKTPRRICCGHSGFPLPACRPRQLPGNDPAYQRWLAEAERLSR